MRILNFVGVQGRGLPKFWLPVNKKTKMKRASWKGKLLVYRHHWLDLKLESKRENNAQMKTFGTPECIII